MTRNPRAAFSLVEFLVVVAIVGILIGLLMPALQAVGELSRRIECTNHFRQLGMAVTHYETIHRTYPPSSTSVPNKHNLLTFVLPHLDQQSVHDRYRWHEDWDSPMNLLVTRVSVSTFRCPSAPGDESYTADYAACINLVSPARRKLVSGGMVSPRRNWVSILQKSRSTPAMVLDGLSNSFMLFEDAGRPAKFVEGRRDPGRTSGAAWADVRSSFEIHSTCRNASMMNCRNDNEIYSFHGSGCNFLHGDGSVQFVDEDIDPEAFVSRFTREAGDVVAGRRGL